MNLFAARQLRTGLLRAIWFAAIWWVLTDGSTDAWLVGIPAVSLATLASMVLLPRHTWSLHGISRFVPFFLWQSLHGGIDVAMRALNPKMPICPDIIDYPLRLPVGLPQAFLVAAISLLPGTLVADLGMGCLRIHVLDAQGNVLSELEKLELSVARIFGARLQPYDEGVNDESL